MTTTETATEELLTADEFLRRHGDESGVELVKGRIVRCAAPEAPQGYVSSAITARIYNFVHQHKLGRVFSHDTFVRTKRGEGGESVRGPDVAFVSYERLPAGPVAKGPIPVPPNLVVEVRSPRDRISQLSAKASEYIEAGVTVVLVIDPDTESAAVYREDEFPIRMHNGDELTLPDVLPGFALRVADLFT
jgi:Uma2 family endonuclease